MLDWLLAPIDPSRLHDLPMLVAWHGRMMVLSWAFLIPLGVIAARFFKILPGQDWPRALDNHVWWTTHRICQYLGAALTLAGLGLIILSIGGARLASTHALFGWSIVLLTSGQVLGGLLRGSKGGPTDAAPDGSLHGDHYSMTRRRLVFEYIHKFAGYLALALGCAAIASGLWKANAPHWMWLAIGAWWGALVIASVVLQRRGFVVDTYQTIWGPDKTHPGNNRRPIGLGISRRDG